MSYAASSACFAAFGRLVGPRNHCLTGYIYWPSNCGLHCVCYCNLEDLGVNLNSRVVNHWTLAVSALGIVAGAVAHLTGFENLAKTSWAATTASALVPLTVSVIRALRGGRAGVDIIALLAMAGSPSFDHENMVLVRLHLGQSVSWKSSLTC